MSENIQAALYKDLVCSMSGHVATLEICRPPHNFFDYDLIAGLADAFEYLDTQADCRAIVLASRGKSFCAGADFSPETNAKHSPQLLYREALRLFRTRKPVVAAVQGAAIGGGLGLSLVGDFRVTCDEARFAANFTKLGFHPGFGLSVTLPRLIGIQQATLLMLTGRRLSGTDALAIGLADVLVEHGSVLAAAQELAVELAANAPLAVMSTRQTLRGTLADDIQLAMVREGSEQELHWRTSDFKEGVAATAQKRAARFTGS